MCLLGKVRSTRRKKRCRRIGQPSMQKRKIERGHFSKVGQHSGHIHGRVLKRASCPIHSGCSHDLCTFPITLSPTRKCTKSLSKRSSRSFQKKLVKRMGYLPQDWFLSEVWEAAAFTKRKPSPHRKETHFPKGHVYNHP